jgi:hypothetical protein
VNSVLLYFFADSNGFMYDNRFVVSGLPPSTIAFGLCRLAIGRDRRDAFGSVKADGAIAGSKNW